MSLQPRFWRLYLSSATSNLADGIGRTALPLLAASYTRSPLLISGLVTFAFLPWLLFALPAGALVDRLDRRHAMAGANAVRAASTAVLAVFVVTDTASIAVIYVVAFLLGLAETVYDSASRAILPQVVAKHDLDRANGLLTVEETLGQTFLGAPVGSALFALAVSVPLVVNAGGFALAAMLVLTLRGAYRPRRAPEPTRVRDDIVDGVRWLLRHRFLRDLTLVSTASGFSQSLCNGVFVLYVLQELRLPSGDFGLVLLLAGVGGLIGGVGTPLLAKHISRAPLLTFGALLSAVATFAMGLTRNGFVGAAFFAASAAGVMVWNVLTMSLRQALIPEQLFGRVQGAYRTVVWGSIPLGAVSGGLLAEWLGVRPVYLVSGTLLVLCALVLSRIAHTHRSLLADPQVEDSPLVEQVPAQGVDHLVLALPPEQVPDIGERVHGGARDQ